MSRLQAPQAIRIASVDDAERVRRRHHDSIIELQREVRSLRAVASAPLRTIAAAHVSQSIIDRGFGLALAKGGTGVYIYTVAEPWDPTQVVMTVTPVTSVAGRSWGVWDPIPAERKFTLRFWNTSDVLVNMAHFVKVEAFEL